MSNYNQVTLVVLAAGLGSRFGGPQQLMQLGYKKQTILEYTLDDAQAIGIKRIVFLIRKEIEADFREVVLDKLFRRPFEIKLAFQELSNVPAGCVIHADRKRPWGTGQAVMLGFEASRTPAAVVVNADDYYGPNALKAAADAAEAGRNAIIAYPLDTVLSSRGPVSRGLLKVTAQNALVDIEEHRGLTMANAPKGSLASMNCFALNATIRKAMGDNWQNFCAHGGTNTTDQECYIPNALKEALRQGVTIDVITTGDQWMGLTHRDDLHEVDMRIGRASLSHQ